MNGILLVKIGKQGRLRLNELIAKLLRKAMKENLTTVINIITRFLSKILE